MSSLVEKYSPYIEILQPDVVKRYKKNMGGVDLLDRVIAKYGTRNQKKKKNRAGRVLYHFLDFVIESYDGHRRVAQLNGWPKI